MTLQERLNDAQQRSVTLYLKRQDLEQQRQQIQQQVFLCEQAMIRSDGEIAVLETMLKDVPPSTPEGTV